MLIVFQRILWFRYWTHCYGMSNVFCFTIVVVIIVVVIIVVIVICCSLSDDFSLEINNETFLKDQLLYP